jgi:hypothetical protein
MYIRTHRKMADLNDVRDICLIYGCKTTIDKNGNVGEGSPMNAAYKFYMKHADEHDHDDENGILISLTKENKLDEFESHLVKEVSHCFGNVLLTHPEPEARLAYQNFKIVQERLRETIQWSEFVPPYRLAALGGIIVEFDSELNLPPLFQPLCFEILDTSEGALHDVLGELLGEDDDAEEYDVDENGDEEDLPKYCRLHDEYLFPMK